MVISDKYRLVFVHIPKTAGQSIERFFLDLHGLSWDERAPLLLRYNPEPKLGPERLAHLTAKEYTDCGYLSTSDYQDYYKFSFVRNPWARLVSEYHYRGYGIFQTFKEFILTALPVESSYRDVHRHLVPQYNFLYDDNGALLVDFIGKFESLQSDFDIVCSKLGITNSLLPHVKTINKARPIRGKAVSSVSNGDVSPDMRYLSYYDEETLEVVGNIYAQDIRAFNYRQPGIIQEGY